MLLKGLLTAGLLFSVVTAQASVVSDLQQGKSIDTIAINAQKSGLNPSGALLELLASGQQSNISIAAISKAYGNCDATADAVATAIRVYPESAQTILTESIASEKDCRCVGKILMSTLMVVPEQMADISSQVFADYRSEKPSKCALETFAGLQSLTRGSLDNETNLLSQPVSGPKSVLNVSKGPIGDIPSVN